tara:strand:+ start:14 stop:430 length:417 start_codon:yes stop_codon:yes gene_type:complete
VRKKQIAFTINNLEQAEGIITEAKIYKIIPILHFKNYILAGFGSDFIITFKNILISKFGKSSFKLFVDCGFNYGLSIDMIALKINYIKLKGNLVNLKKINNIASKNKVLLNPAFNIVDFRNRKKINLKFKKLYSRNKL